jgi:tetratricopeptide (TPR) repeat protein
MRKLAALLLLIGCTTTTPAPLPPQLPTPPPLTMPDNVRIQREQDLAAAGATYEKNPNDADALIWLGRRTAYLGRYEEAVNIFTDGIRKHPRDARMLRHRGHRWITLRQFDRAIADLSKAAQMVRGQQDQIEPDGLPNARNIPTSTLQSNIWYHLGLAHYLRGEFDDALRAYRECMAVSKNPDGVVSTAHWLYMTLRRLGRNADAEQVLAPISTDMDVIENQAYHKLLLMYRGEIAPEELLKENDAAIHYGVANWYLYNGEREKAKQLLQRIVAEKEWAAFGTIAAEAELRRFEPTG